MKKLLKLFMVLVIMLSFAVNIPVYATETADSTNSVTSSSTTTSQNTNTSKNNSSSTTVSSVSSLYADGLSISDILNILLIATGVVIILLAIAIFIKVK